MTAPDPVDDTQVAETFDCDVLVIGAGIAGISAVRAATEAGASVISIDKYETYGVRSSKYGALNSYRRPDCFEIRMQPGRRDDGSPATPKTRDASA